MVVYLLILHHLCTPQISDNDEERDDVSGQVSQQAPAESHDLHAEQPPHQQQAPRPIHSLSSLESESSIGLPDDEASIDIPASTVQLALRPTSIPR